MFLESDQMKEFANIDKSIIDKRELFFHVNHYYETKYKEFLNTDHVLRDKNPLNLVVHSAQ